MRIILWILAIIGGLFVLLLAVFLGFGFVGAKKGMELANGASTYADETIAAYAERWDGSVLTDRAAPELTAVFVQDPNIVPGLSNLLTTHAGAFVSAEPSVCGNYSFQATTADGEVFTALCTAMGEAERAKLQFSVSVVHRGDKWRLLGFYVQIEPEEGATTSTLVSYAGEQAGVSKHEGLHASIGQRVVAVSPQARAITYAIGEPAPVGVHATVRPAQ